MLIITYHFPPRPTIGGLRLKALAKYLPDYGWDALILTPTYDTKSPDSPTFCTITRTRYKDVSEDLAKLLKVNKGIGVREHIKNKVGLTVDNNKKSSLLHFMNFFEEIVAYPDPQKGWYKYGVKAGYEILMNEHIDVIISSSKPETCHLIAKKLHDKFDIPWVADFRDLWTQNHYYSYSFLRTIFEKRLELKTIGSADALVTVSGPLANKLESLHKTKKVYSIPNGYDPDESDISNINLTTKFTITYTGTYYEGKRDPSIFFEAMVELISESVMDPNDVEVRFFGQREEWLQVQIEQYGLQKIVFQCGMVSREVALNKQKESQLLLLLLWNHPDEIGVYTGKIFEYLSAQRPILSNASPYSVVSALLAETNAGISTESVKEMKNILTILYQEFKNKGFVSYKGNLEHVKKYSHMEFAKKYSNVLDEVSGYGNIL